MKKAIKRSRQRTAAGEGLARLGENRSSAARTTASDAPAGTPRRIPIAVTLGDPNGVGPRIVARAFARPALRRLGLVAVGDPAVFARALAEEGVALTPQPWTPGEPLPSGEAVAILATGGGKGRIEPGRNTAWAGRQALEAIDAAADLCRAGRARAMTTAPVSKEAVALVLPGFVGHTGHIAERTGARTHCLCLEHAGLWVAFVTTHVALRQVPRLCTAPRIAETGRLLAQALRQAGIDAPRIGVAGLNPHAGEGGLLGDEEIRAVAPAIARLRAEGIDAQGPFPSDALFPMARAGRFDGIVCLYHDQGHPVMKTLGFDLRRGRLRGVNVTLGLPIVRTSPDHGTGFDIAWKAPADEGSLVDALRLADRMSGARKDGDRDGQGRRGTARSNGKRAASDMPATVKSPKASRRA